MAVKVSFKLFIAVSLLFGVLFACVPPVNVSSFLADEYIDGRINKERVELTSDSEGTAGNRKIVGLTPNEYYIIEKLDNSDNVTETKFVQALGGSSIYLKDIRKLTISEIPGLINGVKYRVKLAKPYPNGSISYFKLNDPLPLKSATVTGGTVTISESRSPCYFDVSSTIGVNNSYNVINIGNWSNARTSAKKSTALGTSGIISSISKDDITYGYERYSNALSEIGIFQYRSDFDATPPFLNNKSIMELPEASSTPNNYVFVRYTSGITNDFYYLTVNVNASEGSGNITVTEPDLPTEGAVTLTCYKGPIAEGEKISISLGGVADKTIAVTGGTLVNWYYNNNTTGILDTPSITIGTAPFNVAGTYTITVEAKVGGVVYSRWFILEITN